MKDEQKLIVHKYILNQCTVYSVKCIYTVHFITWVSSMDPSNEWAQPTILNKKYKIEQLNSSNIEPTRQHFKSELKWPFQCNVNKP